MADPPGSAPIELPVGWLTRPELLAALAGAGVRLNASAEVLLRSEAFDRQHREHLRVVQRTVGQLGLPRGAVLSVILRVAQEAGLALCPPVTGPYLRLAMSDQRGAPDSVMSNGSAPSGSITVASAPLTDDDDFPKGFYLRVVDGVPWLRGYHASDQHLWSPGDVFAFRAHEPGPEA